jgi:hypothetical protein
MSYFKVQSLNSLAGSEVSDAKPQPRIADLNRVPLEYESDSILLGQISSITYCHAGIYTYDFLARFNTTEYGTVEITVNIGKLLRFIAYRVMKRKQMKLIKVIRKFGRQKCRYTVKRRDSERNNCV